MARCGCGSTCACVVIGGDGVDVTGNGQPGNPYVVTASGTPLSVEDSTSIDLEVSGDPTSGYDLTAGVILGDPVVGDNLLRIEPDGLTLTCSDVRPCLSGGVGINYDPVTGEITNTFPPTAFSPWESYDPVVGGFALVNPANLKARYSQLDRTYMVRVSYVNDDSDDSFDTITIGLPAPADSGWGQQIMTVRWLDYPGNAISGAVDWMGQALIQDGGSSMALLPGRGPNGSLTISYPMPKAFVIEGLFEAL